MIGNEVSLEQDENLVAQIERIRVRNVIQFKPNQCKGYNPQIVSAILPMRDVQYACITISSEAFSTYCQ